MAQASNNAILQYYKELALTLRKTSKNVCPCFDARKSHSGKTAVYGDPISCTKINFCFLHGIQKCSFTLWLCVLTHINSIQGFKDFCLY